VISNPIEPKQEKLSQSPPELKPVILITAISEHLSDRFGGYDV